MLISLTELRADLFNKIDQVIITGEQLEIQRKGHIVKIIADKKPSKLSRILERKNIICSQSDDLINNDWLKAWSAGNDLS